MSISPYLQALPLACEKWTFVKYRGGKSGSKGTTNLDTTCFCQFRGIDAEYRNNCCDLNKLTTVGEILADDQYAYKFAFWKQV